jgi:tRNA-splicing ligase RtcB (3'-phosphate/5'-hydroxy nucleic acid ligase)
MSIEPNDPRTSFHRRRELCGSAAGRSAAGPSGTEPVESAPKSGAPAPVKTWLAMPMESSAAKAIERVRRADDVAYVAVMPDVHLAVDVCVGTATATRRLVYPSAVGGDIGCGMLAVAFDSGADVLRDPARAGALLRALGERIPGQRRSRRNTMPMPPDLRADDLSHPSLASSIRDEASLQLGTLGGGNHFVELQAEQGSDQLWLMIHSGSRAAGQAVKAHHLARATIRSASMMALDTGADEGQSYLNDQQWARAYAHANRLAMAGQLAAAMKELFNVCPIESTQITCDHNHVQPEPHFGQTLLVHRKGAMPASAGQGGVVPGSMGTQSYHVEGRGCPEALNSSAHGAGRLFSRAAARERFTRHDLRQQMQGVWFDPRMSQALREEAPKSYKDVRAVMRAQGELVKVVRTLRPVMVYKGR